MSFMAGCYLIGYNAKVCGQTADGIAFDRQIFKRLIMGDWMGEAPQDAIYRGTDLTSMLTFLEADAAAMADIMMPYQGSTAATSINGSVVGLLDQKHAVVKSLVLTSLLTATIINANGGTGASSIVPLTRTLPRTILAENYPVREVLNSNLRDIPIKFRHYPTLRVQNAGGTVSGNGGEFGTET